MEGEVVRGPEAQKHVRDSVSYVWLCQQREGPGAKEFMQNKEVES